MPSPAPPPLGPRKSPVQARSAASVEAILDATLQVLVSLGRDRLTTTGVARRAGVSVGTLYQYFPNKDALLQAALRRHLDEVLQAIEQVCRQQRGTTLQAMATSLVAAFLQAKMRDPRTSVALYTISADVDGAAIARAVGLRATDAIAALLATARNPLARDPQLVAAMLQSSMNGVSRRLLESDARDSLLAPLRDELLFAVCSYLDASSAPVARPGRLHAV